MRRAPSAAAAPRAAASGAAGAHPPLPPTARRQPESRKKEASSFAFGTQQRFGGTRSTLGREAGAPGPGSYDDRGAAGKQPDSTKVTQPAFGFGTAIRFADQRRALSVGAPGPRYKLGSSLQRQVRARTRSATAMRPADHPSLPRPGDVRAKVRGRVRLRLRAALRRPQRVHRRGAHPRTRRVQRVSAPCQRSRAPTGAVGAPAPRALTRPPVHSHTH